MRYWYWKHIGAIAVIVVGLFVAYPSAADFLTIATSAGSYLRLHKNELTLDAKRSFEDPVKFRGGTFAPTGYYVIVSGDQLSGDESNPGRSERGYFALRHNDDYPKSVRATEFVVFMQDPEGTEDPTMRVRLRLTTDYLEVNGQRIGITNTPGTGLGRSYAIWSPNGLYLTQQQDDGNLVWYHLSRPFDTGSVIGAKLVTGPN